jgi:protein SCO1/2
MNRHAMDHPSFFRLLPASALAHARWPPAFAAAGGLRGRIAQARSAAGRGELGGDFTLVNQAGKTVHAADFAGKYTVFYFGYTYCPDVCPLDAANLMQGYHACQGAPGQGRAAGADLRLDRSGARYAAGAGQFTGNFGKELVGLTGTPAQIAAVAKEYAVYYQKRPAPKGPRPKPI